MNDHKHNYAATPMGHESAYGGQVYVLTCNCGEKHEVLWSGDIDKLVNHYNGQPATEKKVPQ